MLRLCPPLPVSSGHFRGTAAFAAFVFLFGCPLRFPFFTLGLLPRFSSATELPFPSKPQSFHLPAFGSPSPARLAKETNAISSSGILFYVFGHSYRTQVMSDVRFFEYGRFRFLAVWSFLRFFLS